MARIINGINGGFTGKVGTVTGYIRNGGKFYAQQDQAERYR